MHRMRGDSRNYKASLNIILSPSSSLSLFTRGLNLVCSQGILGNFGFALQATSSNIHVESEEWLFPVTSLVAEFGGTLGLFLGFSFMALWDGAAQLAVWGKRAFDTKDEITTLEETEEEKTSVKRGIDPSSVN
jgi:hypothetical protein